MSAKTDYPLVERGLPQWEAMVDEIDSLREDNDGWFARRAQLPRFPVPLGKGDRFIDASSDVIWEVLSVDHGVLWVLADVPQPDQEVTMPSTTDTRFRVVAIDIDSDDPTLAKVGIKDVNNCWEDKYPASATFRVPIDMAPRIGEVITMSWGDPL